MAARGGEVDWERCVSAGRSCVKCGALPGDPFPMYASTDSRKVARLALPSCKQVASTLSFPCHRLDKRKFFVYGGGLFSVG